MELVGQKMLKSKKAKEEKEKSKLEARVATMATSDLANWASQAMFGIGRNISDWDKQREYAYLEEAQMGAEALLAVVNELCKRNASTRNF